MKLATLFISLLAFACGEPARKPALELGAALVHSSAQTLELGDERDVVEETYQIARTRKDLEWTDLEIQALCEESAEARKASSARVTAVRFTDETLTRTCYERNFQRTCIKWFQGVRVSCQVTMEVQKITPVMVE